MSYVYILTDDENIKIGVSINPQRRIKQLQTGHSKKIRFLHLIYSPDHYKSIEKRLHKMLWTMRLRFNGEWFKSSPDLLIWLSSLTEKDFYL